MPYLLEALNGPLSGSLFVVEKRAIIGRDADVDIQLIQKGVSRQHAAVLTNDDDQYYLMDLASKNGTFFRGESIGREEINTGEKFRVGETDFLFKEGPHPSTHPTDKGVEQVHFASGPATGVTVDAGSLTKKELNLLKALGKKNL